MSMTIILGLFWQWCDQWVRMAMATGFLVAAIHRYDRAKANLTTNPHESLNHENVANLYMALAITSVVLELIIHFF